MNTGISFGNSINLSSDASRCTCRIHGHEYRESEQTAHSAREDASLHCSDSIVMLCPHPLHTFSFDNLLFFVILPIFCTIKAVMLLLLPLLTVLVVSSPFCLADFITPPAASTQTNVDANPEYKEWDTIQINLSTSFSSFSISLFQAGNNTSGVLILSASH